MSVRIESQAEPLPGYKLIDRLGGGGFGEVWRCEAPGGLHKAIKFVYGNLELAGEDGHRAEQELKALSRVKTVRHPYILSLERYDIIDGQLMIVMELADRNLWDRFKECRAQGMQGIPREELLGYMDECAEALDLMNVQYQLQHLDIKPQNLFLIFQHVKVADFGLVKDLEGMQASVTGGITPVYAAPETFDGWVSRFSDQYSLAIVYQELLTGQRPFSGTNVRQLILQHLQAQPNLSSLPAGEQAAIGRSLAKNPDDRFPSCRDLVAALRAARGEGTADSSPGLAPLDERPKTDPKSAPSDRLLQPRPPVDTPSKMTPGVRTPVWGAPPPLASPSDSSQGTTRSLRGGGIRQLGSSHGGLMPAEQLGEGALLPTYVVGIGGLGLRLLQQVRENLCQRFGSMAALPHIRLLLLETDGETTRQAVQPSLKHRALTLDNLVLAQLNRPSHYIKSKGGLESWFPERMLYRIPRDQVTTGLRALGRLAFYDHFKAISRRIQTDLQAIVEPQALEQAVRDTKLGLRTNRPRVYVLAGLAGGTGSGMFLDLTYVVRAQLRKMGFQQPDVTGVLLVPKLDLKGSRGGAPRDASRTLMVGNTCAALTELYHYADPEVAYSAVFVEREPPIVDAEPPFTRCLIVPLPEETDPKGTNEVLGMTGQMLYRDMASLLGRAIDLGRAGISAPPWAERGRYFQTFGLFQLAFPRTELMQRVARRLCHRLVGRWMTKDAKPIHATVKEWVEEQWQQNEMASEHFITRVKTHCEKVIGKVPETAFNQAVDMMVKPTPAARGGQTEITFDFDDLVEVVRRLMQMLGAPGDEASENPGILYKALKESASAVGADWNQKLAELPVRLIEDPVFRLAGAEEAIRQVIARFEKILEHQDPLLQDLTSRAGELYAKIVSVMKMDERSRRRIPLSDMVTLLKKYAKTRYQAMVLSHVTGVYVGLRGNLSDTLREINFCRTRLKELQQLLEEGDPELATRKSESDLGKPKTSRFESLAGYGRNLYLEGSDNLGTAIRQTMEQMDDEAVLELDTEIQKVIKKQFTALVHVCMAPAHLTRNLEAVMRQTAGTWLSHRLGTIDSAELFLGQFSDDEGMKAEIESLYEEAMPELNLGKLSGTTGRGDLCVLATPMGDAGQHLQELAKESLSDVDLVTTTTTDDILIYREWSNLPLAELDLLGPLGQEAYRHLSSTDNFTPHTRTDVEFTPPGR